MKKVIVIGCPGSGKSTFSRALAQLTGLPLYHLDQLFWNADGTCVSREVFCARLEPVLASDEWIVDGNFSFTMALRMAACDTVFFLDYPVEVCLDGIRTRQGKPRPDMPAILPDGDDPEFVAAIRSYPQRSRPQVLQLLALHREKQIVVFHSREESDLWLNQYK